MLHWSCMMCCHSHPRAPGRPAASRSPGLWIVWRSRTAPEARCVCQHLNPIVKCVSFWLSHVFDFHRVSRLNEAQYATGSRCFRMTRRVPTLQANIWRPCGTAHAEPVCLACPYYMHGRWSSVPSMRMGFPPCIMNIALLLQLWISAAQARLRRRRIHARYGSSRCPWSSPPPLPLC
jgi:hypothetical protein